MARTLLVTATLALVSVATPVVAGAQAATPRRPARAAAPAASAPLPSLRGPREVALGGLLELHGGAARGEAVRVERRLGDRWRTVGRGRASAAGRFRVRFRAPGRSGRLTLRARAGDGAPSRLLRVGVRPLVLAAVGDVNLGDLPGAYIARFGPGYPWGSVGPVLRRADLAFANLECAVSRYGRPVRKRFTFRGRPFALRGARGAAGLDVVNLANNHSGDFGPGALRDTLYWTHRFGMAAVGAGRNAAGAARSVVVRRLGLRIAFVGFSDILPYSFRAGRGRAGTQFASSAAIRSGVRRARRHADVVVATFHWGIERSLVPTPRQRAFADAALRAGATAVIGAHPHVLQPIRRSGSRLVAYSLGNFVFGAVSAPTARTGILLVRLARRGVVGTRFRAARIVATRPVLR